ncbi:MAG: protein-L-isoaspartate(D-aspartate) O-methyltransferase [Gammaproteobacteria bacterium]|jgi:protein-L-isoaspartate(D-aspartate) O-methyltransferase|nr:protein-L-isoaspartate(D-aspartate) O-methyltransferase [Gammaproteobacteria bacterium]
MRTLLLCVLVLAAPALADDADFEALRADLVDEVRIYAGYAGDDPFSDAVLGVIGRVERHKFVPMQQARYAYENRPLPIGHGQTISQPYIVALMTDLLEPEDTHVVLEVGTGSGYQAAVLAELVDHVYSIEIIEALATSAGKRLQSLGYDNVTTKLGDGYYGWEEHAPFDSIIVTAAASHVPPPLIEQLKPGGKMVIPVGGRFMTQLLLLLEKGDDGEIVTRQIGAVRFVPLTGEH